MENLDADGEPVDGEQAIAPGAFTYVRQPMTFEADLTRLVRALLQELKRQVLENVVLTVQTDFDPETGDELHLSHIAALPALVLIGPELTENRFFSLNQRPEVATAPDRFAQRRAPYTVDLGFTVVGVSDHTTELLNLMAATQLFFHRNKVLELDRDPADADVGRVGYEMDFTPDGDLKVTSQPNEANVRSFSGRFVVRGFDLEDLAGVPDEGVVGRGVVTREVVLEAPQPITPPRRAWRCETGALRRTACPSRSRTVFAGCWSSTCHTTCSAEDRCVCTETTVVVTAENPRTGDRAAKRVAKHLPPSMTWLALERREGLPSALLEVPDVKAAIACRHLRLLEQTPDPIARADAAATQLVAPAPAPHSGAPAHKEA